MSPKQIITNRRLAPKPVRKAEDDAAAPIPVYTAGTPTRPGKLVGIIRDPSKLTRVADASTGPKADLTPAPAGEVGIPAADVAKLRKSLRAGTTPAERDAAAELLNAAAGAKFRQIHRRPPRG